MSRFAREAMEKSLPLIRPLWMFNPRDERCQVSINFLLCTNIYTHYQYLDYLYTLHIIFRWWVTSSWWGMRSWWRQCSNKVRSLLLLSAKIFNAKKIFFEKNLFATPGARSRDVFLPGSPDGAEIVWKRGTDGPYYKVSTNIFKYLNISITSRFFYNIYLL